VTLDKCRPMVAQGRFVCGKLLASPSEFALPIFYGITSCEISLLGSQAFQTLKTLVLQSYTRRLSFAARSHGFAKLSSWESSSSGTIDLFYRREFL